MENPFGNSSKVFYIGNTFVRMYRCYRSAPLIMKMVFSFVKNFSETDISIWSNSLCGPLKSIIIYNIYNKTKTSYQGDPELLTAEDPPCRYV